MLSADSAFHLVVSVIPTGEDALKKHFLQACLIELLLFKYFQIGDLTAVSVCYLLSVTDAIMAYVNHSTNFSLSIYGCHNILTHTQVFP